ncbi:MAG: HAD hydrolase-like protein [Anaerolineaceae bacterium]|nr:HAD hydrolase-like protein [Anaerolineaceae bacterium]
MPLTLLLDLDDTLLNTNMHIFMPAYFQALTAHVSGHIPPDEFMRALVGGVNRMNDNEDPRLALREVFESHFYPRLGASKDDLQEIFDDFYERAFPHLAFYTAPIAGAVEFVGWAEAAGFQIAIATDPLFPLAATQHRLRWAGFDPERFKLVSAFEEFHFTKNHPAYYAEVLGALGWQEGGVVMAGNDLYRDILPAQRLGLKTFLVEDQPASPSEEATSAGSLADLRRWLEATEPSALEPLYASRDAIWAILLSTPAVFPRFLHPLTDGECRCAPKHNDWAMNEIASHLRDTEREVHILQVDLMLKKDDVFIPRPDTTVWASERNYLNEDAVEAIDEFTAARLTLLEKVKDASDEIWRRNVRHAIFGPSNFTEVMGFIADHDRLHLQQAWQTAQTCLGKRVQSA